jgi:uncharacterized protein (TIGR00369 family)
MSEETTITAVLPDDLAARFTAAAETAGVDTETLLVELVRDHVALEAAIDTYANRDGASSGLAEHGPGGLTTQRPPIGELLGFDIVELGDGTSVLEFEAGPEHANPMGTLHGGVLCDVGDAAMGTAFSTTLSPDDSFTTLELNVTYLKPVWTAHLTAAAEVVKRNRRTGLVECTVTDPEGSLVAKLSSVCLVLTGDDAAGR